MTSETLQPIQAGTRALAVCRATEADLEDLLACLEDAERRLQALGIADQWPLGFHRKYSAWLAGKIAEWETYVLRADGEPAACFMIAWNDKDVWQDETGVAAYVHKMAVREAFAGNGLGRRILDWIAERAARESRSLLRLDCSASNGRLRDWYLAAAFEHRGDVDLGRFKLSRMERVLYR